VHLERSTVVIQPSKESEFTDVAPDDAQFVDTGLFRNVLSSAQVDMFYKYVLRITPGEGGLIDIVPDNDASSKPEREGGKLKLLNGPRPNGAYGAYYTTSKNGSPSWFFLGELLRSRVPGSELALNSTVTTLEDLWAGEWTAPNIPEITLLLGPSHPVLHPQPFSRS
jgi:hypothetical protein